MELVGRNVNFLFFIMITFNIALSELKKAKATKLISSNRCQNENQIKKKIKEETINNWYLSIL